jgi:hypothetical protein
MVNGFTRKWRNLQSGNRRDVQDSASFPRLHRMVQDRISHIHHSTDVGVIHSLNIGDGESREGSRGTEGKASLEKRKRRVRHRQRLFVIEYTRVVLKTHLRYWLYLHCSQGSQSHPIPQSMLRLQYLLLDGLQCRQHDIWPYIHFLKMLISQPALSVCPI